MQDNLSMFDRNMLDNIEIRRHFNAKAFTDSQALAEYFAVKVSGFSSIFDSAVPKCLELIAASVNDAVSILAGKGVYDYDGSLFMERFGIVHAFEDDIDPLITLQAEISGLERMRRDTRKIKREAMRQIDSTGILRNAVYQADIKTGYYVCVVLAENEKLREAAGLADEELLSRRLHNIMLHAGNDKAAEILALVIQNPFSFQYYKELYLLAGEKSPVIMKLCSLLGYADEFKAFRESAGDSIIAGLKSGDHDTAEMIDILQKSRDTYYFTPSQKNELDEIGRALSAKKASEDEITSAIGANSQEESKADSLIEAGNIPGVWAMLDGKNGLTEYKLMDYYDKLVKEFVERRDFRNIERRMSYVYDQADSGNAFAEFLVSYIRRKVYMRAGDKDRVIRIDEKLLRLADSGQVSACAMVGFYFSDGQGYFNRDYGEAMKYLTFAAEKNHPTAMAWLSDMYHCGNGVTKDERIAEKWLKLSAHYGHPYAVKKLNERGK